MVAKKLDLLEKNLSSIIKTSETNFDITGHLVRIQNNRKRLKEIQTIIHNVQERLSKMNKAVQQKYPNLNDRFDFFGVPLVDLMKRKKESGRTPKAISSLTIRIREIGLDRKELFGITPHASEYVPLLLDLDAGEDLPFSKIENEHALAQVLKHFLNELPDPVCTYGYYDQFLQISQLTETKSKIEKLRILTHKLPPEHEKLLDLVIELLYDTSKMSNLNQMNVTVLGLVFGNLLLKNPEKDPQKSLRDHEYTSLLAETMIEYYPQIFQNAPLVESDVKLEIKEGKSGSIKKEGKKVVLDKKFTGYRVNFLSVFTNKDMREAFIEHLTEEQNNESFEFLLAAEKMNGDITKDVDKFNDIVETFVQTGKKKSLNIPGTERAKILKYHETQGNSWVHKESPLEILSVTRDIAFSDLKFDSFPRFISSQLGYDVISKNQDNPDVITQNPLYSVLYKLKDSFYGEKLDDETQMRDFAGDLSDKHRLKISYLSTQWAETQKLESKIKMSFRRKNTQRVDLQNAEETLGIVSDRMFKGNVKIKIMIIDKNNKVRPKKQGFINFLSPVLSSIGNKKNQDVELYHTALMIGPWMFEWDESELCIPKKCVSSAAILTADVDEVYTLKNLEDKLEKLAEKVVEWNVNMGYRKSNIINERYGNSQDFVESVLEAIGVRLNLPEALSSFLQKIKEKGSTKLEFTMNPEFQKKFNQKESSISFSTHSQLDHFVEKLLEVDKNFMSNHRDDYLFLKSFDRPFWMKHLTIKNELAKLRKEMNELDSNFKIETKEDAEILEKGMKKLQKQIKKLEEENEKAKPIDCPFKDPTLTQSIIF